MFRNHSLLTGIYLSVLISSVANAQRLEIPRRHEKPPGPPISAEEAVKKMVVPEGFSVEIVAKEPDVVNPVAMFIDEKGRFWITESLEYPRREPGPGRDRVKVLEDTDGDGKVDKTTVFADGLNIPSGIAVGYGGVWVANAPDLLFMQDTDGDLKADKIEKVVTGFGRTDTHELPNSLTWGPDGWLYGLNGVFNYSDVTYAEENPNYDPQHPGWKFTCAMFRIHPRTREFQIFAEGTSNPWGIAINGDGEFFISACVIDHLWHIVESAYYIRQGGPYPPHTWPMRSIVDHKHQKAAYCGITWFDSEAYPEEYRNVLYMGNIHGGCINADIVEPSGATYKGKPHPGFPAPKGAFENDTVAKIGDGKDAKLADFLTANDAWFMPVVQKIGPDGCLYILDWYDQYHCYQDANADPAGIEREKGRLYRVVYKGHKNEKAEDLSQKSDEELIELLGDPNVYKRDTAQRLLGERANSESAKKLKVLVIQKETPREQKMHALWAVAGMDAIDSSFLNQLIQLDHRGPYEDELLRAWSVRLSANNPKTLTHSLHDLFVEAGFDPSMKVRRQVSIWESKRSVQDFGGGFTPERDDFLRIEGLLNVLESDSDAMLAHLVWQNLLPIIRRQPVDFIDEISEPMNSFESILVRAVPVLSENKELSGGKLGELILKMVRSEQISSNAKRQALRSLGNSLQQGLLSDAQRNSLGKSLMEFSDSPEAIKTVEADYTVVSAMLGNKAAQSKLRQVVLDERRSDVDRINSLTTLIAAQDPSVIRFVEDVFESKKSTTGFRTSVIESLGRVNDPNVADVILAHFDAFGQALQPKAIEVLTQRDSWAVALLKRIEAKEIVKDQVNLNQLTRIASFKNEELQNLIAKIYGQIREDRRSDRQHVINRQRDFLNGTPGDPHKGVAIFNKVCGQCHKIYGEGAEVGPDITLNGRNNWEQLLQNVFDPSAVIGPGYQARILATDDGRVLTGLAVEENDQRVVLKIQGGKIETIPRERIEAFKISEVSMMPEDLEKQLKPQELADLFAYLALSKPPGDPEATILSGAPEQRVRGE